MEQPKEKPQMVSGKKTGMPLTEEEFAQIKERFFRGEGITEICQTTGRSFYTVDRIRSSDNFAGYREALQQKYNGKTVSASLPQPNRTPIHYYRLKEFRELLDEVLINFIKAEIEIGNRALMDKLESLQKENAKLKEQIEELNQPNFIHQLQKVLTEEGNQKKQVNLNHVQAEELKDANTS